MVRWCRDTVESNVNLRRIGFDLLEFMSNLDHDFIYPAFDEASSALNVIVSIFRDVLQLNNPQNKSRSF